MAQEENNLKEVTPEIRVACIKAATEIVTKPDVQGHIIEYAGILLTREFEAALACHGFDLAKYRQQQSIQAQERWARILEKFKTSSSSTT